MLDMAPFMDAKAVDVPFYSIESKPAISVVGLGYVGAVSTACLAQLGHRVLGVDVDQTKVDNIAAGQSPIHEKDLGSLLSQGVSDGLISAMDDLAFAVRDTDVTFVSVGTPTAPDGGCDYRYIEAAARTMAEGLADKSDFHVFVMRCSIPPGTTMKVMTSILEEVSGKSLGRDFGVAFNPEFLREGVAVEDFYAPPKTVIGATCDRTGDVLRQIYLPVDEAPIVTSIETAEMVKYVDNVWHAAKVTFANEVGRLAKSQGVDSHAVMDIFCQDQKLNLSPYYLKPGFAYGGSCLPKEVRAVAHLAKVAGLSLPMIENLDASNKVHINEAARLAQTTGARRVAILGLAFKPGTDDLRESPILEAIAELRNAGIEVTAHDPAITQKTNIAGQLSYVAHGSPGLAALAEDLQNMLAPSVEQAVAGADAIIITQKTPEYAAIVQQKMAESRSHIIDVVRAFDDLPDQSNYTGIGW